MTSVFLSLLIPSCNCHSNKRWYTGGMLRRYPKSNVSCCAVYQQSLSKMMHFYTNLWILKHTMKQTSGIAAVIYARLRSDRHRNRYLSKGEHIKPLHSRGTMDVPKMQCFFLSLLLPEHLIYKRFLRLSDLKNLSEFFNYWEIPEFYRVVWQDNLRD